MFEKQPPALGYIRILIVSIFFACAVIWSMKTPKMYMIQAQGTQDDTNYFDASNPDDELYYNTFEKYKAQVEQNVVDTGTYKAYGYLDAQLKRLLRRLERRLSLVVLQ